MPKTRGQRPRPRVAVVGGFEERDIERFQEMFPTLYQAAEIFELRSEVDHREVDLLVIGEDVSEIGEYPAKAHTVCFSSALGKLPGPIGTSLLDQGGPAETEEYALPDVSLRIGRLREAAYSNLDGIRGLLTLRLSYPVHRVRGLSVSESRLAATRFSEGAIVKEKATDCPIAVEFVREKNRLGMAWLPSIESNRAAWVAAFVEEWAKIDPVSFPYSDWRTNQQWMTREEESIADCIERLEREQEDLAKKTAQEIAELESSLATARAEGDQGIRRLLVAQGDDLVGEVAAAFEVVGFRVENVDQSLEQNKPKREDLRIAFDHEDGKQWEAIVEVRGYGKRTHKISDLARLERFAGFYYKEKGRDPDKKIYVVNGQAELPPPGRQQPFETAEEDLESIVEDGGLVIWTVDLFRAMKSATERDYGPIRQSIIEGVGLWQLEPE